MADLQLTGITKHFGSHEVLNDLSLHIKSGEFVTLLGPSGCGKTTLLRIIAGLETPEKGKLTIGGVDMSGLPPQRRPIGMVFQSYALFPHMNVRNNIIFGLRVQKKTEHEIFEKLHWVMPLLGLEGLEKRLPKEISGGQRQRVALARALVLDPDVLLLDEPLSNLDVALRESAMVELKRIHSTVGKTIIYVSHNQAEAMTMSERIAVFKNGSLEQFAEPRYLYDYPATRFTAKFIGSPTANSYTGTLKIRENRVVLLLDFAELTLGSEFLPSRIVDGQAVTVCIRPQDIHVVQGGKTVANSMALTVDLIETPGDRNLVIGSTQSGSALRFFVSRDTALERGNDVTVTISSDRLHVFDSETEQRLPSMGGTWHA